jgi:two-component system, OmpR family, sensor histidine kinase MprB
MAVVALCVVAAAALASYVSTASQLRSSIDDALRAKASAVDVAQAGGGGRGHGGDGRAGPGHQQPDVPVGGCPLPGVLAPVSAAQLEGLDGTVTACLAGSVTLPTFDADRAGRPTLRTVTVEGVPYRVLSTDWYAGGTLELATNLAGTDALLHRLRFRLGGLVAVATAVAAALGWLIATRLARPIVRLRDTARHIAGTLDLATPIDVDATGEVGSLAASFATMVVAVRRSQEQQQRLVSDASHEMRTPLTSLRSNIELIGRIERLPGPERAEVVGDVLQDVEELGALVAELVVLASDLSAAEPEEPVDLGHLARIVATRTERRVGRQVLVDDGRSAETIGRPRQLERAVANLVENAVKYSSSDTIVEVVVDGTDVTVRDRGRGIPAADVDHVFERFYRAIDVRTQPGSGLGLSIVEEIVRSHGGTVFARNRDGGGAEVGFSLPPVAA